jgi:hypothetical protein
MGATSRKRYAVVSCHVERPLDDDVWVRFSALQARKPGGFTIAALMRPADASFGEDETVWLERAREAAGRAELGHHTHWTAPDHARPTADGAGARVLSEGTRLRKLGLEPSIFCGGGWYTDREVAEACAELGYVDCTPRAGRPSYLPRSAPWAFLQAPARIRLPSGRALAAIPTTHSVGDLTRALARRSLPEIVHLYFHDTDLLDRPRRILLSVLLPLLAQVAEPTDFLALAGEVSETAPETHWSDLARPSF